MTNPCFVTEPFNLKLFSKVERQMLPLWFHLVGEVLLGWQALRRLSIVHEDFPNPIPINAKAVEDEKDPRLKIEEAIDNFLEVFQDPSEVGRKIPYAFEDMAKYKLKNLESMGIIKKVEGAPNGVHQHHLFESLVVGAVLQLISVV